MVGGGWQRTKVMGTDEGKDEQGQVSGTHYFMGSKTQ